jgi:hypothetical protein
MIFEGNQPETGKQMELFGPKQASRPTNAWDRLVIHGANISNVLFDPSPEVKEMPEGMEALRAELAKRRDEIRRRLEETTRRALERTEGNA